MKDRWAWAATIGLDGKASVVSWRSTAVALALAVSGCVSFHYQGAGERVTPRRGETLIFGRIRFFHDGSEFFPWNVQLFPPAAGTNTERHLWLMRLGRRAVSTELRPDPDGSLAIWLASGDYALLGSTQLLTAGGAPYEVVALFRVPLGPAPAYAGELNMKTESYEGGHVWLSELGETSVTLLPIDIARATLEQRLGTLPEAPVVAPWCAGDHLPGFNDAKLATRAKELLDRGCADAP
jgi:hypothetical protein